MSTHRSTARVAAAAAFLAAFTVAVLLVRSALDGEAESSPARATATQPATTGPATTSPGVTLPAATTAVEPEFYVIRAGDTLELIASREETTVERLLVLNPDVDPVALTIGQRIRVR